MARPCHHHNHLAATLVVLLLLFLVSLARGEQECDRLKQSLTYTQEEAPRDLSGVVRFISFSPSPVCFCFPFDLSIWCDVMMRLAGKLYCILTLLLLCSIPYYTYYTDSLLHTIASRCGGTCESRLGWRCGRGSGVAR